jgi:phosphotransferase system enzyme I (PtsI)/phosphotransferase system enzyme I (PtsP)
MSAAKLPLIKYLVRTTSIKDAEAFLAQALTMDSAQAIRASSDALIKKSGIYNNAGLEPTHKQS